MLIEVTVGFDRKQPAPWSTLLARQDALLGMQQVSYLLFMFVHFPQSSRAAASTTRSRQQYLHVDPDAVTLPWSVSAHGHVGLKIT